MTLDEALRQVIDARNRTRTLQTQVQALKQAFAEQHAEVLDAAAQSKQELLDAEATLRALALETFHRTWEKTVHPGIKIREVTRLTYDPHQALAWAIEHRMALALDVKAFEKIAKTVHLPCVQTTVEPQVTFARWFEGEQPAPSTAEEDHDGTA
jgi:hypothetical protein